MARSTDFDFASFDITERQVTATSFKGHHVAHHATGTDLQYHVVRAPPGDYVLFTVTGYVRTISLCRGTYTFKLRPGDLVYVGNFAADLNGVAFTGVDAEAARAALKSYPNIQAQMQVATLQPIACSDE
jgi:hypothetical protein